MPGPLRRRAVLERGWPARRYSTELSRSILRDAPSVSGHADIDHGPVLGVHGRNGRLAKGAGSGGVARGGLLPPCSTWADGIRGGRPERGGSFSLPALPSPPKPPRDNAAVWRRMPSAWAISWSGFRAAAIKT